MRSLLVGGAPTDLVLLPEASLTGYVSPELEPDLTKFAEPLEGKTCQALSAIAREAGTHLAGPLIEREGDRLFNALVGFGPDGTRILHYRKRHPWYPEEWATAGDLPHPVITVNGWSVTAAICFDVHFLTDEIPELLQAADLLLLPSAWVEEVDSRRQLLPTLAHRFGVAIVNANWGPGVIRLEGQGGSMILDPMGGVLARSRPKLGRRIDAELPDRAMRTP